MRPCESRLCRAPSRGFTLVELLVVIAILGLLIALLMPAIGSVREASRNAICGSNLHQLGLALNSYHTANKCYPPGYVDGNTDSSSTPDNDVGPGWGWASYLLPYLEEGSLYSKIDFKQSVGAGVNAQLSQQSLPIFQCPSDPYQDVVPVYDSNFDNPIATVAHGNYVGCNGWEECFNGASGNPQPGPGADSLSCLYGSAGRGAFYRNSRTKMAHVTDGLSKTIFVGERSGNHSPSTWTGAVPGGRCPAWMATQPPSPNAPPPGPAYDNADFGEALVLAHCNATHLPNADFPIFDPDVFYSVHPAGANFLFGDGAVHFISSDVNPITYQALSTIAGGELLDDF